MNGPSRKECIRALHGVADRLGKSPSMREYDEAIGEDGIPAANVSHRFGSWNASKSAAGLRVTHKHGWTESEITDAILNIAGNQ